MSEGKVSQKEATELAALADVLDENLINFYDFINEVKNSDREDVSIKLTGTIFFLMSLQITLFVDARKALGLSKDTLEAEWDNMTKSIDECGKEYIKEAFKEEQNDE
jgi:hypothetical protein